MIGKGSCIHMTQFTIDTEEADIIAALPQSAEVFRKLRIDFCCGGKVALKTAAMEQGFNPEEILKEIKELENTKTTEAFDPATFGDRTLVMYIQETYHDPLRDELPELSKYVSTVVNVHRSEEHTSELQSRENLVCRLLLEQKKIKISETLTNQDDKYN